MPGNMGVRMILYLDDMHLTGCQGRHPESKSGGAVSSGTATRATWTQEEHNLHINCTEILAASFAVKAFTNTLQNAHLVIRIDNTTTIAYIDNMRGGRGQVVSTRSLCKTSEELASSKETNSKGRAHSRLSQHCRRQGIEGQARLFRLGSELEILLDANDQTGSVYDRSFANRITKFPGFVVTNPIQNGGNRCPDSALIKRSGLCFSPFNFIAKCLRKVIHEKATITLVCPVCPTQPWYAQFLQLVVDTPTHFPITSGLLISPQGQHHPLVKSKTLSLEGWSVSCKISLQKAYQDKLQALSSLLRELQHRISTSHVGPYEWAGIINSKLIPFNLVS
ncbi:uncharacterized protein [Montipora capricornis]|uniref:uncharacterized protein n=1 Tax=Montipora capricornis TaxID=246305 RepID=UPI0035F1A9ED